MKHQPLATRSALRRTLVAAALTVAYSTSWSLETFTFNPGAIGLNGTAVTADNVLLSDYFSVQQTSPTAFTEQGFLSVTGFQLNNTNLVAGGLNSTYSLYIQFSGSGTLTQGAGADPRTTSTSGVFNSLTYSLFGVNGQTSFPLTGTTFNVTTAGAPTLLATGSLLGGSVNTQPAFNFATLTQSFVPSANASLTFNVAPGATSFFSPNPFYSVALTAFTNPVSTVTPLAGGFLVTNGGGSLNFAAPIPEPETYALMLGGLGIMGWMARRRRT
jgi:hypothetical protein